MGIDHIVALECAAKKALGVEGIVDRIKARSRAEAMLKIARDSGDQRPVEQITFKVGVMGMKGMVEEREASVSGLLQHSAALEPHRAACAGCPANRGSKEGFGCYQSIHYPIRADAEEWLVSRLPPSLDCFAGYMFCKALVDFQWDGAQAAQMRESGRTFFESPDQYGREYEGDIVIGSNIVFHMMFHLGHLQSFHARLVCLFLGVLPYDIEPRRIQAPDVFDGVPDIPKQEGQAEELAEFLRACRKSAELDVPLLVDG